MKIKLGIFTSRNILELHELDDLFKDILDIFDIIITVDKVNHPKPSSEGLNIIKDTLKLNSNEIVYIGDHYNDMICAKDASVYFFHARWDNDVEELNTDYIFDKPSKVIQFIRSKKI